MKGTTAVCAQAGSAEHEKLWVLRPSPGPGEGVYALFCTSCECFVGAGSPQRAAVRRFRFDPARAKRTAPKCASCGRDLPRLPPPMLQPTLCAFCREHQGGR